MEKKILFTPELYFYANFQSLFLSCLSQETFRNFWYRLNFKTSTSGHQVQILILTKSLRFSSFD